MQETTDLFGIPVPSTDRVFLGFVVVHILVSLVCAASGVVAMLSEKGKSRHIVYGKIYFVSMISAFVTVVILSTMRWAHNRHLLIIGTLAVVCTHLGYRSAKSKKSKWTRLHTTWMGLSYIFLMTGFYVDNGKNLPFWNQFSGTFFYVFPAAIGIPIIVYVLAKHPLNK
jgi:uncharacterized membrane protein